MSNNRNNQLMLTPEISGAFAPEVIGVMRNSFCPTATDAEFVLFAHKAASFNLDPFKNEIFFIKYGGTARIQFAAEAYLTKARQMEGFIPPDTQIVCDNDTFKAKRVKVLNDKNGMQEDTWDITEHEMSYPRGRVIGAYSVAYRVGARPVTVFVDKEHIAHVYSGQNKDNWNKWEQDMIGKFAQQRALKVQYGIDFGDEEAGAVQPPRRIDVTEQGGEVHTPSQTQQEPAREVKQGEVIDITPGAQQAATEPKTQRQIFDDNMKKLNKTGDDIIHFITQNIPDFVPGKMKLTDAQLAGLNAIAETFIDIPEEL